MSEKILEKQYYRIQFQLQTALAVGSGQFIYTDKDLALDSRGVPYIPATALAGIYRTLFKEEYKKKYFGDINYDKDKTEIKESKLTIYDAVLQGDNYKISTRECVGLDEYKTSIKGAKFNFQILEPGATFVTYIEMTKSEGDEDAGDVIADAWIKEEIVIGAKNARGLGRVCEVNVDKVSFNFGKDKQIENWLKFSAYNETFWNSVPKNEKNIQWLEGKKEKKIFTISLDLKLETPISIRTYTTKVNVDESAPEPDQSQMVYVRTCSNETKDNVEIPYIPGTSWAGAFRHHMRQLDGACIKDEFGKMSSLKSKIIFSESEIYGARSKVVMRNAIDRFTSSTVKGALFVENIYYGGTTNLEIILEGDQPQRFMECLMGTLLDLNAGIFSLGGETAIGHGIFSIKKVLCQGTEISLDANDITQLYELCK